MIETNETYPRFRDDNLNVNDFSEVYGYEQGRPDRIAGRMLGSSRMCKVLCATNHIRNPFPLRTTVRLHHDTIYNELYMQGYRDDDLEKKYQEIMNECEVTPSYWTFYNNLFDGVITEAATGSFLAVPTLTSVLDWIGKYDKTVK